MNIWLVTTGSSDVQLKTDEYWSDWYERSPVKRHCYNLPFKPAQIIEDSDEPYRIAPRVLSRVYNEQPDEVWPDLEFPLLGQFTTQLRGKAIEQILLLVTDQTDTFNEEQREDLRCPYWQDTCELKAIIERYFQQQEEFRDIELIAIALSPKPNQPGLDDWNHVLTIVQAELSQQFSDTKLAPDTVYVSHQASTPAISSAVQFVSLGKFGKQVQFLVSNEYEKKPLEPIKSSQYLRGIKFQEAKSLLERHDYSGVKNLLEPYLKPEIKDLLDAAIQWNFAKFDDFATAMAKAAAKYSQDNQWWYIINEAVEVRSQEWWWTAYESAYLAVVRLKQENTVEAMFHSFRAVEGLLRKWVDHNHSDKIHQGDRGKEIRTSEGKTFSLYGRDLYCFLVDYYRASGNSISKTDDIGIFGNHVFKKRNTLFHQLEGLQDKKAVFENWRSPNEKQWRDAAEDKWKVRIVNCLNFLSRETFEFLDREESDGTVASLMVKVHQELKKAIA